MQHQHCGDFVTVHALMSCATSIPLPRVWFFRCSVNNQSALWICDDATHSVFPAFCRVLFSAPRGHNRVRGVALAAEKHWSKSWTRHNDVTACWARIIFRDVPNEARTKDFVVLKQMTICCFVNECRGLEMDCEATNFVFQTHFLTTHPFKSLKFTIWEKSKTRNGFSSNFYVRLTRTAIVVFIVVKLLSCKFTSWTNVILRLQFAFFVRVNFEQILFQLASKRSQCE